jgi:hypothetical protein
MEEPQNNGTGERQSTAEDLRLLKEKVQWLADGDKRVLQAFATCATALATVTVVIAGYSWYNGKMNYERDKAAMLQELERNHEKALASATSNFHTLFESEITKLENRSQQNRDELAREVERITDAKIARVDGMISNYDGLLASKTANIDSRTKALETNLAVTSYKATAAHAAAEGALFLAQAQFLHAQRDYAGAVIRAINAADSYCSVPDYLRIRNCMDIIKEAISKTDEKQMEQSGIKMRLGMFYLKYAKLLNGDSNTIPWLVAPPTNCQIELAQVREVVLKVWGTNSSKWIETVPSYDSYKIRELGK